MTLQEHTLLPTHAKCALKRLAKYSNARILAVSIAAAVTLGGCASPQPDALLAGDDYWKRIEQGAPIEVVTGNPVDNTIVMESASFTTARTTNRAAVRTTAAQRQTLRALAESSVRDDNPGQYTVVRGDTLWDISERFLSRPWLWPEIWHVNPQIENPHLIYPGDRISLTYVNGKPRLQLIRAGGTTVSTNRAGHSPIAGFPQEAINQFMVEPRVVTSEQLRTAPYVVSAEEGRLISAAGSKVYVRGAGTEVSDAR